MGLGNIFMDMFNIGAWQEFEDERIETENEIMNIEHENRITEED